MHIHLNIIWTGGIQKQKARVGVGSSQTFSNEGGRKEEGGGNMNISGIYSGSFPGRVISTNIFKNISHASRGINQSKYTSAVIYFLLTLNYSNSSFRWGESSCFCLPPFIFCKGNVKKKPIFRYLRLGTDLHQHRDAIILMESLNLFIDLAMHFVHA